MTLKQGSRVSVQTLASISRTVAFAHKREMSRLISAWKQARLASEAKQQVDAVAKAHGVPTTLLPEDWTSMMLAFRNKFGKHTPDEKLPAQSCYEAFADKLAIGALKAEPLAMVVSAFDEEQQEKNKPEPERQYGLSLDSKLTITTKKRIVSSEPVNEKDLRDKYAIMTNMWLLGQMKQPGRSIYRDFRPVDIYRIPRETPRQAELQPSQGGQWHFTVGSQVDRPSVV